MNEVIRKLAMQTDVFCDQNFDGHINYDIFWEQKFAELIVKECIDNVKIWEKDSRNHISYMLKQHFGVEE